MTNDLSKPNENEIDDNWISLRAAKNPPLDGLEYRPVYSKKGWNIIHFKDHNGDYGMRIFFEELEFNKLQEKKFPDWNEIKIKPLENRKKDKGYLDIRITNAIYLEQFDTFCKNIVSGSDMCSTETELLENIFKKCNHWKLLMKNKRVEKLKPFEQQGLIGELTFLKLLMEKIGVRDAIEAWKGPDKLVKDFLLSSIGVEVKTKQGGLKGQVQISSEFQLSKDNLSKLFLLVFTVDKSTEINPNSFTLTEQIEDIKNFIIQKDINSLDEFLGKVYMSRYDDKHDYKSDFWLLVDPYQLFIVKEKSPRISPENINCNFLSEVKYKLSLEGLKDSLLENLDAIYDEL